MKGAKELATPFGKSNGQIRACSLFCISNSLHGLSEGEQACIKNCVKEEKLSTFRNLHLK